MEKYKTGRLIILIFVLSSITLLSITMEQKDELKININNLALKPQSTYSLPHKRKKKRKSLSKGKSL